ncbi:MAG: class I SAM-dependent methyltransferase [Sandaracinaceae bacterium]|nr:class I SAM-dependent methyltransferase [Sandaracinaceae bacterium]
MQSDESERTRRVAIDHHHEMADVFESFYAGDIARWDTAFHYGRHKVDLLLDAELKRLEPGARVLDVGCGTGEYLRRLTRLGFAASGVEPARAMREHAQRRNPDVAVLDGVVTDLPFADGSFDLVIAIEVFRYLHRADNARGHAEIMRVLAPGGAAFITYVNRYALDAFYLRQRGRQLLRRRDFDNENPHCEFTTPREVRRDLRRAGADQVEIHGRLLAPLRLVYKLHEPTGARLARAVESLDDLVCAQGWTRPFAGHLVGIARKDARRA